MIIQRKSPVTGTVTQRELPVSERQMERYRNGQPAQSAFPQLKPEEREFIISGLTPRDWEDIFGEEL